jgi:hypothetical protein
LRQQVAAPLKSLGSDVLTATSLSPQPLPPAAASITLAAKGTFFVQKHFHAFGGGSSGEAQAKTADREHERRVLTDLLLVLVRQFIVAHRWLLSLLLLNQVTK